MACRRKEQAFRPGTVANQDSLAVLYVAFSIHFQFRPFPADARTLLCFAEFTLRSFTATKSVTNALSAVKRVHLDLGFEVTAFEATALTRWKRALPLTVRWVPRQAPALPFNILESMCTKVATFGQTGRVMAALFAVLYHTMVRISSFLPGTIAGFDVSRHPTLADCRREEWGYSFQVKFAKAHQRPEQAFWVPLLPRPRSAACPVSALARLVSGGRGGGSVPLFRVGGTPLSTQVARRWLRVTLSALGLDPSAFTFHSFRRGACAAAFEKGAQLDDLKELGGWRSSAVGLYRPAAAARLRAARALTGRPPVPFHNK